MREPTKTWGEGALPEEPVYEVTDGEGHAEQVDTRDLQVEQ
jgi:hypothetical protein